MSRRTVVVGKIGPKGSKLAMRCAWCGKWQSEEDRILARLGRPVSDGICEDCAESWAPDPEPAA